MSTFICEECGWHFDEPKELDYGYISLNGPASGCPVCGGAYEYAVLCNLCGEEFLEDQLFEGICPKCLDALLTPETGLAYMDHCHVLDDFMFYQIWDSATPKSVSSKLRQFLIGTYEDMAKKNPEGMKYNLRCYLFDRDGCGQQDFAEWWIEHGKEKTDG